MKLLDRCYTLVILTKINRKVQQNTFKKPTLCTEFAVGANTLGNTRLTESIRPQIHAYDLAIIRHGRLSDRSPIP